MIRSLLIAGVTLGGCGVKPVPLMPTPVVYTGGVDPFPGLGREGQTTHLGVFYATDRAYREGSTSRDRYGNGLSTKLRLGTAVVSFGGVSWDRLRAASTSAERDEEIVLRLEVARELAAVAPEDARGVSMDAPTREFIGTVEKTLRASGSGEILIYVHGATVDFDHACVYTAQLAHFAGREAVGIAYAWPTHQDVVAHVIGGDRRRAVRSAAYLRTLIELLGTHTNAERINVLGWDAGARVVARALEELRRDHPHLGPEALQRRFRVGTVVVAAGDHEEARFDEWLPDIHEVAERIVVTVSDVDALRAIHETLRVEAVDVSDHAKERGFDLGGHRYWFHHPWVSSDLVLLLRSGLAAPHRGLERDAERGAWSLPADYPQRVRGAVAETVGTNTDTDSAAND